MALLPTPTRVRRALADGAAAVVRRILGIERTPPGERLTRVPDDLPRDTLFRQPLSASVTASDPEAVDGGTRVTFRVVVRDADGKRCPDLFVEAEVTGPERTATGDTTTDLLGVARFRMTGGPGTYRIRVTDVAAHALTWNQDEDVSAEVVVA